MHYMIRNVQIYFRSGFLERLSEKGENIKVKLAGFHTGRVACEMQQQVHEYISTKVWQRPLWINSAMQQPQQRDLLQFSMWGWFFHFLPYLSVHLESRAVYFQFLIQT